MSFFQSSRIRRGPAMVAAISFALASLLAGPATAAHPKRARPAAVLSKSRPASKVRPAAPGAARVAINVAGVLRQVDPRGRRAEPLTLEEDTARRIEELLRGPLRVGTTGIYVADARTGQPVFAVHPDDALNPASNVKLLSTAAAIEILGPDFRYQTRVIGSVPHQNVVRGDLYLLGSFDPTLNVASMEHLAAELAAAGVTRIEGDVVVGANPTRDVVYRALLPVEITAGTTAAVAPTVNLPVGYELVVPVIKATTVTGRKARRARLTFAEQVIVAADGHARVELTIGGTMAAGKTFTHWFWVRDRGLHAAHLLRAALAAQGVAIIGDVHKAEISSYLLNRIRGGDLPVVLARHQSAPLADIVASVNKRSINWLADRVIMTAAALKYDQLPTMQHRLHVGKDQITIDTGSGLSYATQFSPRHLTEVLRVAGGFTGHQEHDPVHRLWLDSLAFSDGNVQDGTLRGRFRSGGFVGRLRGKTGTLSTSIALSGVLESDPERPLVTMENTNGSSPLPKGRVRAGHDRIVALLSQYLIRRPGSAATMSTPHLAPVAPVAPVTTVTPVVPVTPVTPETIPTGPSREAPDELGLGAPEADIEDLDVRDLHTPLR
jgi:serine-type D-Ala-D-Ala carboxypeptidase/endopeptidase (penicillin-binding protein 4)